MKVKDLIEHLQKFDPELPVMVDGYEDGITDLEEVKEILAVLNQEEDWWYGKHKNLSEGERSFEDAVRAGEEYYKDAIKVKAILLPRE